MTKVQDLKKGQKVNYSGSTLTVKDVHVFETGTAVYFEEWSHCVISSQFGSWNNDTEFDVVG